MELESRLTIACISRIIKIEIPYLWAFIRHYRKLGVDKIYLLSTIRSDYQEIHDYLLSKDKDIFSSFVALIDLDVPVSQMATCINQVDIKEDYLLNADIDEFLELEQPDLQSLLADRPSSYYHFGWVMAPNDRIGIDSPSDLKSGFDGHTGKYMVRLRACRKLGLHKPDLRFLYKLVTPVHTGRMIHYWGRSFKDVLFKCCYQKFDDSKKSSLAEVHGIVENTSLPARLKLLALLCRKQRNVPVKDNYLAIDYDHEKRFVSLFQLEPIIDEIHQIYEEYKSNLSNKMIDRYPKDSLLKIADII